MHPSAVSPDSSRHARVSGAATHLNHLLGSLQPPVPVAGDAGIAPRAVRRAEAYIQAHVGSAVRLDDIAAAAGVPVRTLLDGFKRFRACSPMQMLREYRLAQARERLCHAGPDTRVADVALDCGFSHLGRFAGHYQQRYGETPSDTLRRARQLAA